jgi:hypothetical protein
MTAADARAEELLGLVILAGIMLAAVAVLLVDERRKRRERRPERRLEGNRSTLLVLDESEGDRLRLGYTIRPRPFDWSTDRDQLRRNARFSPADLTY